MTPFKLTLALALALLRPDVAQAFGWNWLWGFTTTTASTSSGSTSASSSGSNYQISLGNRNNTTAGVNDYGTNISNVQINLARFNGTALAVGSTDNLLSEAVYEVAETYRNKTEQSVRHRIAWFDEQIHQASEYADRLRRNEIQQLLGAFENNTREVDDTTSECLKRAISVEDLIRSVRNRSEAGCLEARIQQMVELRNEARMNLSGFLENRHDVEDRLVEVCVDLQDGFEDEMIEFYRIGCVSSVLFDVQLETARANLTIEDITAEAGTTLRQVKAGLLECVSDLANYAFQASLALRHWINVCGV